MFLHQHRMNRLHAMRTLSLIVTSPQRFITGFGSSALVHSHYSHWCHFQQHRAAVFSRKALIIHSTLPALSSNVSLLLSPVATKVRNVQRLDIVALITVILWRFGKSNYLLSHRELDKKTSIFLDPACRPPVAGLCAG